MPILNFPDPRTADDDGLVAIGGDLAPATLLSAYRRGIFPWPTEGLPLLWFSPGERGVLHFADLHLPRSLRRALRLASWEYTIDRAFTAVIDACASSPRPEQEGTWITPQMRRAYIRMHERGHAHSVEVWDGDELVGGIYGMDVDGAFAGESMFHRRPNASKAALLHLVEHLQSRGLDWLDIQVITPHMARLGARPMPRDEFLKLLAATRARGLTLF